MAETITNVSVGIVTGERSKIDGATVKNGRIYFSKDTGELFYDWNGVRVQVCPQTSPNNATLSIKANGTDVSTFTANSSINRSIDISAGSNITISGTASTGKIVISGTADTKNTAGSSSSTGKLFLVGAGSQNSTGVQTYSNANVYTQNGSLYATAMYEGTKRVATEEYVDGLVANATHYKGTFNATNGKINGGSTTLTSVAEKVGDLYKCDTAGTYLDTAYEVGDSIYFISDVAAGTAPTAANITSIEGTVSVSVPSTVPTIGTADTTLGTVEGVVIKAKIGSYLTRSNLNSSLNALDASVLAGSGQYVAGFEEVDGLIKNATYGTLPTVPSTPNGFAKVAVKGQSSSTAVNLEADSSVDILNMTGGTGIMLVPTASSDTVVVNHTNSVTAVTDASLLKVKYDAQGHITGSTVITKSDITGLGIPGSDTDTKNTTGNYTSNSTVYLVGPTSVGTASSSYGQTYANASVYMSAGKLYSNKKEVATTDQIPTVNNGTLTITVNGSATTFTANQAGDSAVNITIPSLSDLDASFTAGTNQAIVGIGQVDGKITTAKYGTFLTSHQSLAGYATETWVNSSLANYSKGNSEIYKGTCSTGATTAAKVVTCSAFTSAQLVKGAIIFVTFDYTNTAAVGSITMNVNSTGAKPIKKIWMNAVSNLNNNQELQANETYIFQYDGTNWVCMNCDWTYTYSKITTSAIDSLSTGDNWCIDGSLLKYAVDKWAPNPDLSDYATKTYYNSNMPNNFSGVYVWATPTTAANASISVSPDSSKDVLTFKAGTNVTLTGDATNDIVTINATNTTYSAGDGININTNNQISSATNIKVKVGDSSFLVPTGGSNPGILDISAGPNVTITPDVNAKRITVAASGFVQGDGISIIKAITQSAYEALSPKDPSTVYIVTADLN